MPFVSRFHGYPSDIWRFTPEAIRYLFPKLHFDMDASRATISTFTRGEVRRLPDQFKKRNRFIYRPKSLEAKIAREQEKPKILDSKWEGPVTPYILAPSMVNLIATKPARGS